MDRQPGEQSREKLRGTDARFLFGLAWSLCVLCVYLAGGSLIFAALNDRTLGETFVDEGLITLSVLTAGFSVAGALVASTLLIIPLFNLQPEHVPVWVRGPSRDPVGRAGS